MVGVVVDGRPGSSRKLAVWRVLVWLVLLYAALGCLQYVNHAQQMWNQLHVVPAPPAEAVADLQYSLGWDLGELLGSFVLVVIGAGCALRQDWARPCMRVAAPVLAAWFVFGGFLQWQELHQIDVRAATASAQTQLSADIQLALVVIRRNYEFALVLRAIAVPLLLWLSWMLGQPSVRAQFRRRRRP